MILRKKRWRCSRGLFRTKGERKIEAAKVFKRALSIISAFEATPAGGSKTAGEAWFRSRGLVAVRKLILHVVGY